MNTKLFSFIALNASLLAASAAALPPELLFRDTFDSAATIGINDELATRQSGPLAPLTYTVAQNAPIVSDPEFPNAARLNANSLISLNYNFTQAGVFIVDFDVDPGANDDPIDGLSGDWCAVILGATSQNPFVNGSDGVGILFRNSGEIQTFAGGNAIAGGPGIPGGLPRDRKFHVKIEATTGGFAGPASVKMWIDGQEAAIGAANSTTLIKNDGFRGNYLTIEGYTFTAGMSWAHIFDNLDISAVPAIVVGSGTGTTVSINRAINSLSEAVTVTVPAGAIASGAAQVRVISNNPAVAVGTGADANGVLTLNFAQGGPTSQTFTVSGTGVGNTTLRVEGPADVAVNGNVNVFVIDGIGVEEMLFRDTFNVSEYTYDANFENQTARQNGPVAPLDYLEGANTAAGGSADERSLIDFFDFPGKLVLTDLGSGVSPARNFIDGPEFYIEAEVNPGANQPPGTTDNWAAIVFGTSTPNSFVISADGFGILFRNNGAIQVFNAGTAIYSSEPGVLPAAPFRVRIDVDALDFAGAPATVSMKINEQPFVIAPGGATSYVKAGGFRGNYITLEGIGAALAHVFDDLVVGGTTCVHFRDTLIESSAGATVSTTVRIPSSLTATAPFVVTVTSSNPSAANIAGAANAVSTLTFGVGESTKDIEIQVAGSGASRFTLANTAGICMGAPLVVNSRSGLVKNPSFEENYNLGFPHYSAINDWTGGSGVNQSTGPFADNGAIPDRARVAFLQGTTMSQAISGLEAGKQYWLQFRYNVRNCCGGTVDLVTSLDGVEIDRVVQVAAVGAANDYGFRNVLFTAANSIATISIGASVSAGGDMTAVIDAVSITQRDEGNVIVENPSFEASGDVAGNGVITPQRMAGWAGTGVYGVNFGGAGPFADNGAVPDQDYVAFIQGPGASLTQTIRRLTEGERYRLKFAYNAPLGKRPHLQAKVNGAVVWEADVEPVGAGAFRTAEVEFVAAGNTAVVSFEQTLAGEQTALLDNIQILGQAITLPCLGVSPAAIELSVNQSGTIGLVVPPQLIESRAATIRLRSSNASILSLDGAAPNGELSVTFEAAGSTRRDVTIIANTRGSANIEIVEAAGLCVDNGVAVTVSGSFVRNPSFDATPAGAFPGYGPIASWTGGSGLNTATGPFHDNGMVPDRQQIGFLQNSQTLSQEIINLTEGQNYWLQFRYNTRNDAANSGGLLMVARVGDSDLITVEDVRPVGVNQPYHIGHASFTTIADTAMLTFQITTTGDRTLLLDGVTIVQRAADEVVVLNPSFEAEGRLPFPGYVQPYAMSGWSATGNYGVNVSGEGPFADNGINSDQDSVAFLQNLSSMTQAISGLEPGRQYTLTFSVNARGANRPRLRVRFAGDVLLEEEILPVGGSNPYRSKVIVFTPVESAGALTFEQVAEGDHTVLIDDVRIVPGAIIVDPFPQLTVAKAANGNVRISWPSDATTYELVASAAVDGTYARVNDPVIIEGQENVVIVPAGPANRYFTLRRLAP